MSLPMWVVSGSGLHQGMLIAGTQIGNRCADVAQVVVEFVELGALNSFKL